MVAIANVKIWENKIGVILWDEMQHLGIFEFDKNFLKLGLDISPILMPLSDLKNNKLVFSYPLLNSETFKGLPGFLSDSLPELFGNQIIATWLANQSKNIQAFSPVDRLGFIGKNGIGALEFETFEIQKPETPEKFELADLIYFINKYLNNKQISAKNNTGLFKFISILGGENPKASVGYNSKTDEIQSNVSENFEDFEHWIIKLDGIENFDNTDSKIEYAYYLMALDCGITISESKLILENNRSHFMTKRFDRQNNRKIHLQTLCGLAHFDYKKTGYYSYEQIFQVVRQLKLPYSDSEELYRRMVFNVMSRNQNDHSKSFSFLMFPDGKWQLSPTYDLVYANNQKLAVHQMSVNGKIENILLKDLLEVAKCVNVKKPKAIIDKCNEVLFNWDVYAKKAGVDSEKIREIERELIVF